jgi:hypothetical protein
MRRLIDADWPVAVIVLGLAASLAWTTFLVLQVAETVLAAI